MTNKKKQRSWTYRIFMLLVLISIARVAGIAFGCISEKMLPWFCSFIILWHINDIFDFYKLIFGPKYNKPDDTIK
ncbi:hypothetical protein ACFGBT_004610 [Salmonella enterica subsp. enterica serovar Infantis]